MGLGELLGIKQIKLELKGNYTIEELFDKIKDVEFEAGEPKLVKNGFNLLIAFPQLDRNNQVQILGYNGKYSVTRAVQPAGLENMVANAALDKLTGGWSSMSGGMGNTKKLCMELVTKTADKINALGI